MRIALVYDWVNKFGGAERILLALHQLWPKAPLYTAVYDARRAGWAADFEVRPSFLQNWPLAKNNHENYLPLFPLAFEQFDFSEYELVISVSSAFAKNIITKPQTLHINYCLTPPRYLWNGMGDYENEERWLDLTRLAYHLFSPRLRQIDFISAQRVDKFLAISENVKRRIKKYYRREAEVIYPPVDTEKFVPVKMNKTNKTDRTNNYFLIVSRLVPYKRVDIIIEAFNNLGWPLKIIGQGREKKKLEGLAKGNIEFLGGQLTDEEVLEYYQHCTALIFAGLEDFGLVSLEAQACGKPVIAYGAGGLLETVVSGKTGEFFWPQTNQALTETVRQFDEKKYKSSDCRQNAVKYNLERFKKEFKEIVEKEMIRYFIG